MLVFDFQVRMHDCSISMLVLKTILAVLSFLCDLYIGNEFVTEFDVLRGVFTIFALSQNFHGQHMFFFTWIGCWHVWVWPRMHFIVGDIIIWLQSGFEFCVLYMVFIVRRWPEITTVCDLFRRGIFQSKFILSAQMIIFAYYYVWKSYNERYLWTFIQNYVFVRRYKILWTINSAFSADVPQFILTWRMISFLGSVRV